MVICPSKSLLRISDYLTTGAEQYDICHDAIEQIADLSEKLN